MHHLVQTICSIDTIKVVSDNGKKNDYLSHHGVLGQKWGVRRYQNPDGSLTAAGKIRQRQGFTLPKGSTVGRIVTNPDDPTYDKKKYVSITEEDQKEWDKYLGSENLKYNGQITFQKYYDTVKDLKIAGVDKQTEVYGRMLIDKHFKNQAKADQKMADKALHQPTTYNYAENISRQQALQTKTAKAFNEQMRKEGYQGVIDTHGTNVSKLPVIIYDPDQNLSTDSNEWAYSDYANKWLKDRGFI